MKDLDQKLRTQVLDLSTQKSTLEEKVTNLEYINKEIEDRKSSENSMLQKELSKIRESSATEIERISS